MKIFDRLKFNGSSYISASLIGCLGFFFSLFDISKSYCQEDSTRKALFKTYPLAYYTPETRIAFEAFAFYTFYSKGATKKSNIRFFATYTQNKQFLFILPWQVFTSNDNYFINGSADLRYFPEYFYGLGNQTRESERILYTFNALTIHNKTYKNLSAAHYIGIDSRFQSLVSTLPQENELFNEDVLGSKGYTYCTIGPSYMKDKRNHVLCPTIGEFFEVGLLFGASSIEQMTLLFWQLNFDYRHYFEIKPNKTWAHHVLTQFSWGSVPFRALPTLGGPYLHRGYYLGRFRDKNLFLYQTEYRQKLIWRIGFAAFASAGSVFHEKKAMFNNKIHKAAGIGLRFKISKKDQTNIRFDYSFTPDSRGFYIYFAEAF